MELENITTLIEKIKSEFSLTPITAAEIEFYSEHPPKDAQAERGRNQWEICFAPASPQKTIAQLVAFKANQRDADFRAMPFADQPGSGLHIHIHLEDATGKNVFYKDDERISDALKWSLGGLLSIIPESMAIYAPKEEDRARLISQPGSHAPSTLSWGANNRTCALRLPDSAHDNKRIEHRVAGANADPEKVMVSILEGIHRGLSQKLDPGPQTYGDAHLEMYGLPSLRA